MTSRQNETVTIRPNWSCGIEAQVPLPKGVNDGSHRDSRVGMSLIALSMLLYSMLHLTGVKTADDPDYEIVGTP